MTAPNAIRIRRSGRRWLIERLPLICATSRGQYWRRQWRPIVMHHRTRASAIEHAHQLVADEGVTYLGVDRSVSAAIDGVAEAAGAVTDAIARAFKLDALADLTNRWFRL